MNSQGSVLFTKIPDICRSLRSLPPGHPGNHQAHMYPSLHELFKTRSPAASRPQCLGHRTSCKVGSLYTEPIPLNPGPLPVGSWNLCVYWGGGSEEWKDTGQGRTQFLTFHGTRKSVFLDSTQKLFLPAAPQDTWHNPFNTIFSVPVSFINNRKNQWLLVTSVVSSTKVPKAKNFKAWLFAQHEGGNCVNKNKHEYFSNGLSKMYKYLVV